MNEEKRRRQFYTNMTKGLSYHSEKSSVYHIYDMDNQCTVGNNIETENLRIGDGGKELCSQCKQQRLSSQT